jgi:hypothetical protein
MGRVAATVLKVNNRKEIAVMTGLKPAVERRLFIDRKIREGSYPNTNTLAKDYGEMIGKSVHPRTIAEDISNMKELYGAPVHYDAEKRGYIYSDPSFVLDLLKDEPSGLKNAFLSRQEPDKKALDDYHKAMIDGKQHEDPLSGKVSVIKEGETHGEVPPLTAQVRDALANSRELRLLYKKIDYKQDSSELNLAFRLYHLAYIEGNGFLFGQVIDNPAMPYAMLNCSHIIDAQVTGSAFEEPDYVSLEPADNGDMKVYLSQHGVESVVVFTPLDNKASPEWLLRSRTDVFLSQSK